MENQFRESLSYIEIVRGNTRPIRLDDILTRRMEDFIDRRLRAIRAGGGDLSISE